MALRGDLGESLGSIVLESGALLVEVLAARGGDIRRIACRATGEEVLALPADEEQRHRAFLAARGEAQSYATHYAGGWNSVIPLRPIRRARGGDLGVPSGEFCLLPFRVEREEREGGALRGVELRCCSILTGLCLAKVITVRGATVEARWVLRNETDAPMVVHWAEHPAFRLPSLEGWLGRVQLPAGARRLVHRREDGALATPRSAYPALLQGDAPGPGRPADTFIVLGDLGPAPLRLRLDRAVVEMQWSRETWPFLWVWMRDSEPLRTIALEPSTDSLRGVAHLEMEGLAIEPRHAVEAFITMTILPLDKPT